MENILSQNVKRICKERKIQLKELAARMGIDPAALTRALNGNCRFDTMKKMADGLGVSMRTLFEQNNDVEGFIRVHGQIHKFNNRSELERILYEI